LDISIEEIIGCIEKLGAYRVGNFHQKRFVYDYNPVQKGKWIRLRTNGKDTTLTLKEIKSQRMDGTDEVEVVVSDFDEMNRILNKLGYEPKAFQENFRIEYRLGTVTFDIDIWPGIPAYLEIEGKSEKDVLDALEKLEFSSDSFTTKDIDTIYSDIYGISLDEIKDLRFSNEEMIIVQIYRN